ncbi:MAG TPA: EAL domain-containing protein [Acidobacteriaceae bacterium]|nr:EAL domain-containing protein [Acidobacteriaceae bacterium]
MPSPLKMAPRKRSDLAAGGQVSPPIAQFAENPDAPPPYSMAFQPVVDLKQGRTVAYEALVRGLEDQPAAEVFSHVAADRRSAMDQRCRVLAIDLAVSLGLLETGADLCINFNPNAIHESAPCLERTVEAAACSSLPLTRIVLEITEMEHLRDPDRLRSILRRYRSQGLRTAIDDFGAGFAGLSMLASYQPDIIKIDIALTREIHRRPTSRVILRGVMQICRDLDIQVIAEGVEVEPQVDALRNLGIHYMQGNYFGPPAFEALPLWSA